MDSDHPEPDNFHPPCVPVLHLFQYADEDASELDLFQLFNNEHTLEHLVTATDDYAEETDARSPTCTKGSNSTD